jgi:hypothetical protein
METEALLLLELFDTRLCLLKAFELLDLIVDLLRSPLLYLVCFDFGKGSLSDSSPLNSSKMMLPRFFMSDLRLLMREKRCENRLDETLDELIELPFFFCFFNELESLKGRESLPLLSEMAFFFF